MKGKGLIISAGAVVGILAVILVLQGNPANMGFCIACFLRDIAGGLGLHRADVVQYLRPEIMGLVLGAFIISLFFKEFKSTGGSSPGIRFLLGALMMCAALIFLGCPLRMLLRLAGGDWNALIAIPGYIAGIWVGTLFLRNGYSLGKSREQNITGAFLGPAFSVFLIILLVAAPAYIFFSSEGPGAGTAPIWLALGAGLLVGVLAQRSRLCTMGAFRDIILFRDFHLFYGILALFVLAFAGSLAFGLFDPGFIDQPVAHTDGIWNFLSMGALGLGAVMAGGCPMRQLILTGEGDSDALLTVLGMIAGAAFMHNFGLAGSPEGVGTNGIISVFVVWAVLLAIGSGVIVSSNKQSQRG